MAPLEPELAALAEASEERELSAVEESNLAAGLQAACERVLAARAARDPRPAEPADFAVLAMG